MSYNSTHTGAQIDAAIDAVETKQDRLVSGTNIKTINGQSVMGSGNLSIEATGTYECTYDVTTYSDVVAAIQAGKTPIVKIGNPYEDVFTLSEWDKQNEILCFNSAYMEVYEGDDSLSPDFSISAGCVLLKNTPDSTTTPNGWTTSLFQAIPRSGTIYTKEEVDAQLDAKQDKLTSGTNIKTVNGESLLGSGDIEIQGGGGGMPMWETITTSTGTASKSFDLSTYNEVMIVADILRNNAHHLYSVTLPVECLYDTAYEVKLSGGYATSSVCTAAFYSISKTSGAGVSAYINGTNYVSTTTWKVFGRTNFSTANFMVGNGAPAASIGNNGDLFLKV